MKKILVGLTLVALSANTWAASEKKNMYLFGADWSFSSYGLKSTDLSLDTDSSVNRTNFEITYLRNISNGFWAGPYIGMLFNTTKSDEDEVTRAEWAPGVEVRKFFSLNETGYISVNGRLGWAFAKETDDSNSLTTSYNGFNYGIGLSSGQRFGGDQSYIFESHVYYTRAALNGELSASSSVGDIDVSVSRLYFGLSLGKEF